ncbi:catalase [Capronia coronata CBS 617.96]|uniref:Catalase n=1 Tax=Capronia coronata CBS 617.96 TaxID=1182541 RepID=W9Y8A0_9EURO|nr:catalase [Capronia coronata CBS 617.96]EXJ78634.1 catalase [Capronia coronata CBS 617.96]
MATSQPKVYTLAEGAPLPRNDTSVQVLTKHGGGLVLLQDTQLIETLAHFSRERIPERVVHAKAAGARGYFQVTHDISDITDADFLNGIGKKTEVLTRISTVGPESGSADTVRDIRGWAIKFKTNEGNNDWVFNNHPVFFVRDPIKFPSMNRSHKRHPATHSTDPDMFWDYHVNAPESVHALMFIMGDRGTPASLRHINGYSGHTYKFTKKDGSFHYVKIHIHADGGVKNMPPEEATKLAGSDPDYLTMDLYNAIEAGNYPSYTVYIQTIHPADVAKCPVNIFDITKTLPHAQYPLRPVGKLVFDKNPTNYFAEIEQAAFSPSTMVPGIEASADPMLQARLFAYPDAARYRLGVNYQMLPTNAAKAPVYIPTERDGFMNFGSNYGADPNYLHSAIQPTSFRAPPAASEYKPTEDGLSGPVVFTYETTDDDFKQPRALWNKVLARQEGAQDRFVANVAGNVASVKREWLRERVFELFRRVDNSLGDRIEEAVKEILKA